MAKFLIIDNRSAVPQMANLSIYFVLEVLHFQREMKAVRKILR